MLEKLFCPNSIAVIGASRDKQKVGSQVFQNILRSGFEGDCYPVNPNASEIDNIKCYSSIGEIPSKIELAIIAVPSKLVPKIVADCAVKGVKNLIVLTAGFKETGIKGARLENEVIKTVRQYNMRLVGPNCLGIIDTFCNLNATFARSMPMKGSIAFMSQSGALCTSILDWSKEEKVGFSRFVSLGNKIDLNEIDFLESFAADPQTKVIAAYLEGINNGSDFMKAAKKISKAKPILVIKAGTTGAGARAVSSHTGALAGSDSTYNTAFRQSGIIRAESIEDLFDYANCFANQPIPKGTHVAILTNAGGPGIMATDACERKEVPLADFEKRTIDFLQKKLPQASNIYNPVDVRGDALARDYELAAYALAKDKNVNALIIILTPQAMTEIEKTAEAIVDVSKESDKPILACFMGKADVSRGVDILKANSIPQYYFPERAVSSLAAMLQYQQLKRRKQESVCRFKVDRQKVRGIFKQAVLAGQAVMGVEAKQVVEAYGIKVPKSGEATDLDGACKIAAQIGYPVALKIASPRILHKTDIGGVKLGIKDDGELREAYEEIYRNTRKYITKKKDWNVNIDEMVDGLLEVIIGVSRDPQFGPVVMFGLGGIFVEALKDVVFRIAPISKSEAVEMVREIRAYPVLRGIRGKKGVDIDSIANAIIRISQLAMDFPEISEIDINPLKVFQKGSTAVDVRILLGA